MIRAILIHGNGGGKPTDNWLPYLKLELEKIGIKVEAPQFPDANLARASYWLPFLQDSLKADDQTIIIGHSSGAIAAMKFAEKNCLLGSMLVGAYHTDLGLENEKLSGYFDEPWDWEAIKKNQQWIIQFASLNDPWIPIKEAHYVRDKLHTIYHESTDQGHFGGDYYKETFPEALAAIKAQLSVDHKPILSTTKRDHFKKIAQNYAKRLWDDQDLKVIDELIHPTCIIHSLLGNFYGPVPMKTVAQAWLKGFPDLLVKNTAVICEQDLVVIQWLASGTHQGTFKGIEPTGKAVAYHGVTIYRIEDDKITEYWAYLDMQHLLQQLS